MTPEIGPIPANPVNSWPVVMGEDFAPSSRRVGSPRDVPSFGRPVVNSNAYVLQPTEVALARHDQQSLTGNPIRPGLFQLQMMNSPAVAPARCRSSELPGP